jgi:hypothetical protein
MSVGRCNVRLSASDWADDRTGRVMGFQADDDPGPGNTPGPGESQPDLLAAFEHGGAWDAAAPSARLATALAAAAGPRGLYEGAEAGALVGIVRQWAAIESWAAAGMLGALRAMMREDGQGRPLLRRRNDLPDGWSDSLNYEIAAALAMGPVSAGNLANLALTLGARLPGIGRLLANGTLTKPKAKLIVRTFEPLDEDEATRAEALILGELEGKTWFQVERLAWRACPVATSPPPRPCPATPTSSPAPANTNHPAPSPTTTPAACKQSPTSTSSTTSPPTTPSRSRAPPQPPPRCPRAPRRDRPRRTTQAARQAVAGAAVMTMTGPMTMMTTIPVAGVQAATPGRAEPEAARCCPR